jgi:UPF0271 protein
MTQKVDLNADIGESFGVWTLASDGELMPLLTSANLACGFHASDPLTMARSVELALEHHVALGAHPGYPDLIGFGRRDLAATPEQIYADVLYQIGALGAFIKAAGGTLHHVKPHGALYLKMLHDAPTARAVAEAVMAFDAGVPLVVLAGPGGAVAQHEAEARGVRCVHEAFPDRAYLADGRLAPRSYEGAMLHDPEEIARRAVQIALEGSVTALSGEAVPLKADTLCLHGDNPAATVAARAVRDALERAGVVVTAF